MNCLEITDIYIYTLAVTEAKLCYCPKTYYVTVGVPLKVFKITSFM